MHRRLPPRPNIEYYRKQAKALLRAYRENRESARLRVGPSLRGSQLSLADAQGVVAREVGFCSWALLKSAITGKSDLHPATVTPDSGEPLAKPLPAKGSAQRNRAGQPPKQRYEHDPNVRRWLKARSTPEDRDLFSSFLSGHRERDWIISSLHMFHAKGLITDVVGEVKAGKEATVYRCTAADDRGYLAAKIYRPRMFRNLQNDAVYRENRMADKDRRSRKAMDRMTRRGRAFRMESWIKFEFDTLQRLHKAGADVPRQTHLNLY